MIEDKKRNISFVIIVVTILLLVAIVSGGLIIIDKLNYKEPEVKEIDEKKKELCNIELTYYLDSYLLLENEIKLTDEEKEKFNDILVKLEYSEPNEGMNSFKYHIQYCDTELIIGEDENITKGTENVEIVNGYDELVAFLEEQEKKINRVFLYEIDITSQDASENYEEIEMTEVDKNRIRDLWNNQEKNIEYLDLSIELGKKLFIDDTSFDISFDTPYVFYHDGYVILDEEIRNILKKYIVDSDNNASSNLKYTINNDMSHTNDEFSDRGVYYDASNVSHYFTISSGTKPSGGYSIEITKVNIDEDNNVEVIVNEMEPGEGEITISVLTYPICGLELNGSYKSIVVKNEAGEVFKHLNF